MMRNITVFLLFATSLLFASVFGAPLVSADDTRNFYDEARLKALLSKQSGGTTLISAERSALLPQQKILQTLNIRPGMKVLDIGAGIGVFSFPFAAALQGNGTVYATDNYKPNIEYLEKAAKERGYPNIVPVFIQGPSQDPFYQQHSFDIIFMCDVLPYIWLLESYFRELRPSLVPGTGRIFILEPRKLSLIDESDLGDFTKFSSAISRAGADFPIFKRLSKKVRDFFTHDHIDAVPPPIRKEIVKDLNAMLLDKNLFHDLVNYCYAKRESPESNNMIPTEALLRQMELSDARYVRMLVTDLDDSAAFEKEFSDLPGKEKERFHRLNKVLLFTLLKISSFSYRQELVSPYVIFRSKKSVIAKVETAGYTLVADHDFLPKYYFLEFKRNE